MNRRGFLGSIIALGAAPAIVRVSSLMTMRSIGGIATAIPALVDMNFHAVALTLTMEEFSARIIRPTVEEMARIIDNRIIQEIKVGDQIMIHVPERYRL